MFTSTQIFQLLSLWHKLCQAQCKTTTILLRLMDPMGQEFRKDTVKTSCLWSSISGASFWKSQTAGSDLRAWGWHHLKVCSLTRLAVLAGCWLGTQRGCWLERQHLASPCPAWASSQQGGWVLRVNIPRPRGWSYAIFYDQALEVTRSVNSTIVVNPLRFNVRGYMLHLSMSVTPSVS